MNDTLQKTVARGAPPKRPEPVTIGATKYRPHLMYGGYWALLDKHGDPRPGDPHGPWQKRSTQLAFGHKIQAFWGWQYTTTSTYDDIITPPAGDGWELNTYVGVEGHQATHDRSGRPQQITYWRRRDPNA